MILEIKKGRTPTTPERNTINKDSSREKLNRIAQLPDKEAMQGLLSQISLKDVVDILIVTFLIYQGLLIVYGTRAVQMLTGVGILVGLFWVVKSLR